ncbi:MAG TPA: hypothetical protein VKW76_10130 [Candidatus Binatia bacterium]|nr:hypothetical protein [Candidatus Binatia bacterium]
MLAGMVGTLGICTARASTPCTAGSFADDNGTTTCNKAAEACQAKIGGLVAKAVGAVIKCHGKQAAAAFSTANNKPKSFDEEACEDAAVNGPKGFVAAAQAVQAKAAGACDCVQVTTIAGLIKSVLDGSNSLVLCEPGANISDFTNPPDTDDTGTFDPSDPDGAKAMQKAGTCVAKMVGTWEKCHASFAQGVLAKGADTTDPLMTEEACEGDTAIPGICKKGTNKGAPCTVDGDCGTGGVCTNPNTKSAIAAFNACLAKVNAKGALPGCVTANVPQILGLTKTQLDGANGLVWCAQ